MTKPTKQQLAKWKANRKKWVKALRSKKYQQGEGALLTVNNTYCCMGVLCDVIGMKPRKQNDNMYFARDHELAPYTAVHAVGLSDEHGTYYQKNDNRSYHACNCLTSDNDEGLSFEEIANLIENEPKGLFRE